MFAKAKDILFSFSIDENDLYILRYALGSTIIVAIAMGVAWDLSYLVPVLALGFFAPGAKSPSFIQGIGFVAIVTVATFFGLFFTKYFIEYTWAFIPMLALFIFYVFYTDKLIGMAKVFMLLSLVLIPMMGLQSIVISYIITKSLIVGSIITILVVWMVFAIFPDKPKIVDVIEGGTSDVIKEGPSEIDNFNKALEKLIVIFPLLLAFFFFQWTGALIVLIMTAVLSLQPSFTAKTGLAMILGNLVGGVAAIVVFELLVVVPQFNLFLLFVLLIGLIFATKLFSKNKLSPLYGMAFSTFLLILGDTTSGTDGASSKVWMRLLMIMLAVIYLVVALNVVEKFKDRKKRKLLSKQLKQKNND